MKSNLDADVDVVVVGAGPSGAIVTHRLAAAGYNVVCLEQGDWVNPGDYPGNSPEWELLIQQKWAHDPSLRGLPADYPTNADESDMSPVMFNGVGGSTIMFGGQWMRLLPSDFRVRSLDGVADDWPIDYRELAPYYSIVDQHIGVSGLEGDPAYPEGLDYPLPPLPLAALGRKMALGANNLGWHWWPGSNAIPSARFKDLARCARRGVCEFGCPEGSKASADVAFWPHALKSGATLVTGARVRQVLTDADGRANGVLWLDREGKEHKQTARAVVMCANGIGTSRILLMSNNARQPEGLSNSSGMLGENLMLHPNASVHGFYGEDLDASGSGPVGQLLYSLEFAETRPENPFTRGYKLSGQTSVGVLGNLETQARLGYDTVWGENFLKAAKAHKGAASWAAVTEDLPERHNRIVLDQTLTDSSGLPAPRVLYRISDDTRARLRHAVDSMTELHVASGAESTVPVELWLDQPGHLLGTARMGDNPETSVVDRNCESHDVPNLFIADGSVFVTGGSVNPTATICALAWRLGEYIAATAKQRTGAQ
ncbi:GMC family oxidoreductase [Rhodococcus sp. IEGM1428]|uniref:GMC family oxidoreductase n=1 Tax=Rhodococcus sp. IEGM1428 TaxID=3392191 RepID=UPI003D0D6F7C